MRETKEAIHDKRESVRMLLRRWGDVPDFCRRKHEDIRIYRELMDTAAGLHSHEESGMGGGGRISDPTGATAARLIHMQMVYQRMIEEIDQDCEREMDFARAMDCIIDELTPTQRKVIRLRYRDWEGLDRTSGWTYIARKLHYSEDGVRDIERRAVDQIAKRLKIIKV